MKSFGPLCFLIILATGGHSAAEVPGEEQPVRYFENFSRQPLPAGSVSEPRVGQPIIWIVIDALRPDHLGAYGYPRATSPALDTFADQGVVFTRFLANSSWTRTAVTSMLTGRIPTRHTVQCDKHKLPAQIPSVARQLKQAGYTTLAVVGNGNASSAFGLDQGFDVFEDTTKNWTGLPNARQVYDLGLELLKKHRHQDKVFLFLFIVDLHDPYRPKPPYDEMFLPGYQGEIVDNPRWEYNNDYPPGVRDKIVALYDGLIRSADDQTRDLFEGLKRLGFYDRSSIFITADHGEAFGEHGVYKHGYHLYESHLRIPLLVRAPWLKVQGRYSSAYLQQLDLFPTFCQLAGAPVPGDLQGLSLVDALRDRSTVPVPRYVLSEYKCYGIRRTSVRTRAHKLIYQQPANRKEFMKTVKQPHLLPSVVFDREVFSLFRILVDPREKNDIWPTADPKLKNRLFEILRDEIDEKKPPKKVEDLDPQLVEELRSMGYVQ